VTPLTINGNELTARRPEERKMEFDCTPEQYHHGLDILWQALGSPSMDGRTVWERVRDRICELDEQLAEARQQIERLRVEVERLENKINERRQTQGKP
jgi:hypothetical protein